MISLEQTGIRKLLQRSYLDFTNKLQSWILRSFKLCLQPGYVLLAERLYVRYPQAVAQGEGPTSIGDPDKSL